MEEFMTDFSLISEISLVELKCASPFTYFMFYTFYFFVFSVVYPPKIKEQSFYLGNTIYLITLKRIKLKYKNFMEFIKIRHYPFSSFISTCSP